MTTVEQTNAETNWYSLSADDAVEQLDTDSGQGLSAAESSAAWRSTGPTKSLPSRLLRSGRRPRASSSTR